MFTRLECVGSISFICRSVIGLPFILEPVGILATARTKRTQLATGPVPIAYAAGYYAVARQNSGAPVTMKPSLLLVAIVVLLLAACAATTKQMSWADPERAGQKVSSVFIIGAAHDDLVRRLFEDELARRLVAAGATGMASYQHMDLDALDNKEAAVAKVRQLGADSVIVAKVVGERGQQVVNPGITRVEGGSRRPMHSRTHWHDHWRSSYTVVSRPPTVTHFRIATVETNLYGIDEGMIWSMRTETATVPGQVTEATVTEFVDIVVKDLVANGLL